jgi:hypothetical protein
MNTAALNKRFDVLDDKLNMILSVVVNGLTEDELDEQIEDLEADIDMLNDEIDLAEAAVQSNELDAILAMVRANLLAYGIAGAAAAELTDTDKAEIITFAAEAIATMREGGYSDEEIEAAIRAAGEIRAEVSDE